MNVFRALIDHVRADYAKAQSVAGYLKRRLLEKGTWLAVGSALLAADKLQPTYAAASIAVALVIALLPTP